MSDNILQVTEKELLKNGRATCPNPECTSSITAEEKDGRSGSSILEYWCENENCQYHKKRIIHIPILKVLLGQIKSGFGTLGKKAIAGVIGGILVIGTALGANLGDYMPGWLKFTDGPQSSSLSVVDSIEFEHKIKALEAKLENCSSTGVAVNSKKDVEKIDSLKDEISKLETLIGLIPVCQSELKAKVKDAEKAIKKKNQNKYAREIFYSIYDDPRLKNSFIDDINSEQREEMVNVMADSYWPDFFTQEYLESDSTFDFLKDFLDTFETYSKDRLLGRAYYNLPHNRKGLTKNQIKRYQLRGLAYYLEGARKRRFSISDPNNKHIRDEIDNVLVRYRLFQENFPTDTMTIKKKYEINNKLTFLIDWINKVEEEFSATPES